MGRYSWAKHDVLNKYLKCAQLGIKKPHIDEINVGGASNKFTGNQDESGDGEYALDIQVGLTLQSTLFYFYHILISILNPDPSSTLDSPVQFPLQEVFYKDPVPILSHEPYIHIPESLHWGLKNTHVPGRGWCHVGQCWTAAHQRTQSGWFPGVVICAALCQSLPERWSRMHSRILPV